MGCKTILDCHTRVAGEVQEDTPVVRGRVASGEVYQQLLVIVCRESTDPLQCEATTENSIMLKLCIKRRRGWYVHV